MEDKLLAHFPHSWKPKRKLSPVVFSEVIPVIVRRLLLDSVTYDDGSLLKNTASAEGSHEEAHVFLGHRAECSSFRT